MKLVSFLQDGRECVGVLSADETAVRPLPFADMNALMEVPRDQLLSAVKAADTSLPLSAVTLLPGTIIATGTPAGVGMGFDPPKFLKPGDVVECTIEGIGTLRNTVR